MIRSWFIHLRSKTEATSGEIARNKSLVPTWVTIKSWRKLETAHENSLKEEGKNLLRLVPERPSFPPLCLPNRTAGIRGGRQNARVWQMWQGYYLRVLSSSALNINVSVFLQKDLFKKKWSLAKSYFQQNYCIACHTRFAVFFPLPSCCVSSLIFTICAPVTKEENLR